MPERREFGMPYVPTELESWREFVERSLDFLEKVPAALQHHRPIVRKETSRGVVVLCEPILLDLAECAAAGVVRRTRQLFWHYVVAKNEKGELLGTNVSYVTERNGALLVGSDVQVIEKGQGFASPISEVFQEEMQRLAHELGRPITWRLVDGNLQKLIDYQATDHPDPQKVAALQLEHDRWLALYGPGGKFGIVNEEKTFYPKSAH